MPTLKEFVNHYVALGNKEWELLASRIETHHFKKGETIQFSDDIWSTLYYINSGLIRSYILGSTGKEATRQLHFNNENATILNLIVVDYVSMVKQTHSLIGFEVLQDCELIAIPKGTVDMIRASSNQWEKLSRMLLESAYIESTAFYQKMINHSARENYQDLLENMPHLIGLVPQYHLATFIGVTPVTLSRIKKEMET